jgi:hypothetical protein
VDLAAGQAGKTKAAAPAAPVRIIRPTNKPKPKARELPKWEEADLIDAIAKATPSEIAIDTHDRQGRPRRLIVKRNILNQAGMGSVLLTYKHPAINDTPADASTIVPMSKVPFSIYDAEIDIEKAMASTAAQLKTAYGPKPEHMEPSSGPEPGPLRLDMQNQPGEYYGEQYIPGQAMVADPVAVMIEAARRENDALAPSGSRFNK